MIYLFDLHRRGMPHLQLREDGVFLIDGSVTLSNDRVCDLLSQFAIHYAIDIVGASDDKTADVTHVGFKLEA